MGDQLLGQEPVFSPFTSVTSRGWWDGGKRGEEEDRGLVLKTVRPEGQELAAQEREGLLDLSLGQGLPAQLFL